MLESLGQAVRAGAFAVPGALGVQEGGYVMLGRVVGLGTGDRAGAVAREARARAGARHPGPDRLAARRGGAREASRGGEAGMSAPASSARWRARCAAAAASSSAPGLPLVRLDAIAVLRRGAPAHRARRLRRPALPRAAATAHRRFRGAGGAQPARPHRGAPGHDPPARRTGCAWSGTAGATPGSPPSRCAARSSSPGCRAPARRCCTGCWRRTRRIARRSAGR